MTDTKPAPAFDPIDEAARRLINAGIASAITLKGCSETDVSAIENAQNVTLPEQYRRFLLRMGRTAGEFLVGTDFLLRELPGLRRNAEILLQQCRTDFSLSTKDFVFAVHQGTVFLFFSTQDSFDPPVLRFMEGEQRPTTVADSFSQWLLMCVADEIAAYKSLQ
jgi:hypothetical protein